ncbi:MAG: HNH endonuclease signature motif containing protein [Pseudobdellovibrionaceae bacterium]
MATVDAKFLTAIRKLQCIACGNPRDVEAHHIKTKGSGGGDDPWNVIPLCSDCHTQAEWAWHRNIKNFFRKYRHVWTHIIKNLEWDFIYNDPELILIHPAYRDQKPKQKPQYEIGGVQDERK